MGEGEKNIKHWKRTIIVKTQEKDLGWGEKPLLRTKNASLKDPLNKE